MLNLKDKSHAVTAELTVPSDHETGVVIAQGGAISGWSFYLRSGLLVYCYNLLGLQRFKIVSEGSVSAGTHQVRMEFAYDGGGVAKGGEVTLFIDGRQAGEGRVAATVLLVFSADETADIGRDTASPVSDHYDAESSVLAGNVAWVSSILVRTPRMPTI